VTGLRFGGEALDRNSTLDRVLQAVRAKMAPRVVKDEVQDDHEQLELGSTQLQLLRQMKQGAWRFDPSRADWAFETQKHLTRRIAVADLRHTHENVGQSFVHGEHGGEGVQKLTEDLVAGKRSVSDIVPLVVVELHGEFWVVFGNRRLRALKEFDARCQAPVSVRCIVHSVDAGQVPTAILAQFLLSSTTRNGGAWARIRPARCPKA